MRARLFFLSLELCILMGVCAHNLTTLFAYFTSYTYIYTRGAALSESQFLTPALVDSLPLMFCNINSFRFYYMSVIYRKDYYISNFCKQCNYALVYFCS